MDGRRRTSQSSGGGHQSAGAGAKKLSAINRIVPEQLGYVKAAFGIDNAKQMPIEDTVRYFIPTAEFRRLFVAKNQVLLGSRGSGKTTWIRMLAHDHVWLAAQEKGTRTDYAKDALNRNLIGIYVPASAAFAGDLRNKPWQTEEEAERYFVWRLNLHTCSALTHILGSCIDQYVPDVDARHQVQADLCRTLAKEWAAPSSGDLSCTTFEGLRFILSDLELRHQSELRRKRTTLKYEDLYTDHFDTDLFLPVRHCINAMRMHMAIPDSAVWMICLDEVEYLTETHHRILNTQMRAASGDLVLKVATMPFAHHTLATNLGDPVREGNDFEYIYVDQSPIDSRGGQAEGEFLSFAREMFRLRISNRLPQLRGLTLKSLLGFSPLIDEKKVDSQDDIEGFMELLRRHANPATIARAERLRGTQKFKSEIVRKMHGALILREAIQQHHGNARLRVYAGEATIVRCCDGNARRLMRVINQLVQKINVDDQGRANLPLEPTIQNEVLEVMARDTLNRTESEPPNGALTYRFLTAIGRFVQWQFSSSTRRLGTDQVSSVTITEDDGTDAQRFIKQAIQLSLMIPARDVTVMTPDRACTGTFHLAFLFAPLFHILPRRNDTVRLSRVLSHSSAIGGSVGGSAGASQQSLLDGL